MARTAITVTTLVRGTESAFTAGTTGTDIDNTNSHVLTPPAGCPLEELLLVITNTTASTKVATIKAGDNPPATASGLGDKTVSLTAGNTTPQTAVIALGSDRFIQDDGTVLIDIAASMTGKIACYRIPRS